MKGHSATIDNRIKKAILLQTSLKASLSRKSKLYIQIVNNVEFYNMVVKRIDL